MLPHEHHGDDVAGASSGHRLALVPARDKKLLDLRLPRLFTLGNPQLPPLYLFLILRIKENSMAI